GFHLGGRVVHAVAFEVGETVGIESPVAGPAGDDYRAPGDIGPVRQADHEMPGLLTQRGGRTRAGEVGAELLRLHHSPLGEVAAGDPGREAEVVLDARATRGLAPNGDHLDDQGVQSLRGAIDRRCQTGWPRADDEEVETALGKAV